MLVAPSALMIVIVRNDDEERAPIPTGDELFHWVHWDPFRKTAPFASAEEGVLTLLLPEEPELQPTRTEVKP